MDDLETNTGEGLRLDKRGRTLRLSRGGALNTDLVNPNPNVSVYTPNFQSDFLPSNCQAMSGSLPPQIYMGDMMSNSVFRQLHKKDAKNSEEVPQGKVLKLSLFLVLTTTYWKDNGEGDGQFEVNSGKRAEVIRGSTSDDGINDKLDILWNILQADINKKLDDYAPGVHGSGWVIKGHKFMDLNMDVVTNTFVRSYFKADKHTGSHICNVQNKNDEYCLLYCYIKHRQHMRRQEIKADRLNIRERDELLDSYPDLEELVTTLSYDEENKREFKEKMREIEAILQQNINVIKYKKCEDEDDLEYPKKEWFIDEVNFDAGYYVSYFDNKDNIYEEDRNEVMTLLLMINGEGESHFAYVKSISGLYSHVYDVQRHKVVACPRTLYYDKTRTDQEHWLNTHDCHRDGCQRVKVSRKKDDEEEESEENSLSFHKFKTLLPVPVIIVADFESTILPNANHQINSWCFSLESPYGDIGLPLSML